MPKIQVNGTELDYKEIGTGDKILISTQNFFFTDCHMELLGKPPYDYHVYLITMRGYGESGHVYDNFERDWVSVWGEDVLAFAEAKGIKQFYYSGVSHGCWAGWYISLHKPEMLKGFVAASGVVQFTPPNSSRTFPPKKDMDLDTLIGNREALRKISWNTFYPTKDLKRLVRREACKKEHLEIMIRRKREEFLIRNTSMSCCGAQTEEEFYQELSKISVPILIINGIRDNLSTPDIALKVASTIPGAKMITYENFEHAGPDECPEIVARDCDRFFNDIEGRIL
jgi:pimeloyl-ACP methyl ester carboxylesterase